METIVIKRDGRKVPFDKQKIISAIEKAMSASNGIIKHGIAENIADNIENTCIEKHIEEIHIHEIEEQIYNELISKKQKLTAKCYEDYRAVREAQRKNNTIDQKIIGIIKGNDENISDNSNKNHSLISTMRDLVAEEVSKDYALRMMLPPRIANAHNEGLIYIHDLGHYLNPSANCCLVDLKDILQNGTVINRKAVNKPHSFRTACTISTQVIAQVASGQFGGQTITLTHLAPFVRISREKIQKEVEEEVKILFNDNFEASNVDINNKIKEIVDNRLAEEVRAGIQTFQYQINTLQTSNGQAPFLSVLMYISEDPEYETETAMLIEEMLKQRIQGMQNEVGAWITPAFPKLLYVLDENNIHEDSKYYYLTQLAAKCIVKRMMPDCLSAKILKQNYGEVVAPMGCRAFLSPYSGPINNTEGKLKWYGRFNMGN